MAEQSVHAGRKKDTVRSRKAAQKAAAQRFVPIAEIRNDTVVLKNGGLRAVLMVEALNFNLKSETEQKGIIARWLGFVYTLSFPILIVIRSARLNIDPYLEQLRKRAESQQNQLLKEQTLEYASFVERIVDMADIMQKRFYVVVPVDELPERRTPFAAFLAWMGLDDSGSRALRRHRQFESRTAPLRDRVNLIEAGLRNIGLATRRLATKELIELYYQVYNPETSQEQKLTNVEDLNTETLVL